MVERMDIGEDHSYHRYYHPLHNAGRVGFRAQEEDQGCTQVH